MYLCHCDLWIVLVFNNRKNKYEKKHYKNFYCINVLRVQITNYISFKIIHFYYVHNETIMKQ